MEYLESVIVAFPSCFSKNTSLRSVLFIYWLFNDQKNHSLVRSASVIWHTILVILFSLKYHPYFYSSLAKVPFLLNEKKKRRNNRGNILRIYPRRFQFKSIVPQLEYIIKQIHGEANFTVAQIAIILTASSLSLLPTIWVVINNPGLIQQEASGIWSMPPLIRLFQSVIQTRLQNLWPSSLLLNSYWCEYLYE